MNDQQTTVAELRRMIEEFADRRQWQTFHGPKNLAMSIAIEAAELMEHFQWLSPEQSRAVVDRPEKLGKVAEELADVTAYVLAMANALGLDLSSALAAKMAKNEIKYPAQQYRGVFGPDDPNAP